MIPLPHDFAREVGEAVQHVQCERCGTAFDHIIVRTAIAASYGDDAARDCARREVQRALANSVDAVYCPSCGHSNAGLVRQVRLQRYGWMTVAAALGFFASFISYFMIRVGMKGRLDFFDREAQPYLLESLYCAIVTSIGILALRSILRRVVPVTPLAPRTPKNVGNAS